MKKPCRPADICAHLGDDYDRYLGAIVPPLFQNTLFTRKHEEHGYSYSRINNPTIEILEKKLAALEHAPAARVFASGMAAITATLSSLLHSGGHVLALRSAYHPVIGFLDTEMKKYGVEVTYLERFTPEEIERSLRPNTRVFYLESPSSNIFRVLPLREIAAQAHACGADFHNRYPYSGKIICEEHGKGYHRQLYKTQAGSQEVWQCRVYRDRGRAGGCSPQLWTTDLNQIMARIFEGLVQDKEAVINAVMKVIEAVPNDRDFRREIVRVEEELQSLEQKKDRLLEMSIAGAINMAEFKKRNDGFNDQMQRLELQLAEIRQEEEKSKATEVQMQAVRAALEQKLSFENGVDAALVTTILDHIVVKKGSKRERVELEIFLKFGDPRIAVHKTGFMKQIIWQLPDKGC